jgi:hypothetical protein
MLPAVLFAALSVSSGAMRAPDQAQPKKKPAPPPVAASSNAHLALFTGKYADAKASAKERNVPILIHIVIEGEAQNDEYREKILPEKELVAACANVIVIVANNGTHPLKSVEEIVDGKKEKREVCSFYGVPSCSQHQRFWDDVYREFKEDNGEMFCPQTVVLSPDGKVSARINTRSVPPPTEIIAAIKEAQQKAGPGLTDAQLVEVKRLLREGHALMAAKTWPEALRTWQKVLAITTKTAWGEEAQKGADAAQTALAAELERVSALLVPGTAAQGYKELVELDKQCTGLAIAKDVKSRIAKAETAKETRDEIAAYKLAAEADALLVEAQGCFDAKQDKKGERVVRRLFAKRYATTPAAAKARELWPDWAKEEDAKTNKP